VTAAPARWRTLRVRAVVEETHDAKSMIFDVPAAEAEAFRYRPGQFLTLRLPVAGRHLPRCYSMSSAPMVDDAPRVTVKRVEGGRGSNWLCDHVQPGSVLEVLPPAGVFTPRSLEGDFLLLAGGSGITPMMSIARTLLQEPRILILDDSTSAVDLITDRRLGRDGHSVYGAYVLDNASGRVRTFQAGATVLAIGGAGKAFLYTTNPDTATGDGIAMAWRAGCRVANLEFIQFHPTCLYHPHAKSFLITEAMRGEGAVLRLPDGTRFMPEHDERAELAPRDVVARAIDFEMKKRGLDCVYLDITHKPARFIVGHFPTIHARCLELGIDITREWIPVAPAAHYTCGGVLVDRNGQADAHRLYVVGEAACTGLHGANRLASNSLLECLVYGRAAAAHIAGLESRAAESLPDWDESRVTDADEEIVIAHNWHELRRFMWDYVGIVRTTKRLERAAHRLRLLNDEIFEYYSNFRVSNDLIELRNLVLTADLIVRCARERRESRGLHFSRNYPDLLAEAASTVLEP